MLGKQLWRVLQQPQSLVARVYKAKYFPSCDILQASLGDHPSFAWRSLLHVINALRYGFHWRLGINSVVPMHGARWGGVFPVQFETNYMDNTAQPVLCGDFMILDALSWNGPLVQQVFTAADAEAILQCVISPIHSNIRMFGWRAAHEALPVGCRLAHVDASKVSCCLCGYPDETVTHALRDCSMVSPILAAAGYDCRSDTRSFSSFGAWLENMILNLTVQRFVSLLVLLWKIWHGRNLYFHEGRLLPGWQLIASADALQSAFSAAMVASSSLSSPLHSELSFQRWQKPPVGTFKINVDGACPRFPASTSIGVLVRDSAGLVVAGEALPVEATRSAGVVEALALWQWT
ncbi:uncharacterized protein LOC120195038 [Hibiscus syriacus]|uniref:uncharacterized protein LOC120195038 n=1 Tax=Hibiscus syriacus TaxID=106335 RepID=UPI0019241B6F|nr:uncharacterized protein LOC120195038 [Hibiscus syriacus]